MLVWQARNKETALIERSWEKLAETETVRTEVELVMNLPEGEEGIRPFTQVTARLRGDAVKERAETAAFKGDLYLEAKGRGNIFYADGRVDILPTEVLFRLENIPAVLQQGGSVLDKWTRVETEILQARNAPEIHQALAETLAGLRPVGESTIEGEELQRFSKDISAAEKEKLTAVLEQHQSGSPAWDSLGRLLKANDEGVLDVWINEKSREIRRWRLSLRQAQAGGSTREFGILTMNLMNYGSPVTIERQESVYTAKGEVFAKLFGRGEVGEIEAAEEDN
jgi:hypothetical protein